jgi:drug/metabolite transporter (DMT)-like permease
MTQLAMTRLAVPAFVLFWSTGFVVARGIVDVAAPNLFLAVRFALAAALFGIAALAAGVSWPRGRDALRHLGAGALQNGVYLGAGYWAVANGVAAGVMSLMGAMQPLLTAALAGPLLAERVARATWAGLVVGFLGVGLVLAPKLSGAGAIGVVPVLVGVVSILGITAGSLVQKSGALAAADLRAAVAVQNVGGGAVCAALALALEERLWVPGPLLWGYLVYAVLGLSAGSGAIFIWLLRRGQAARATALIYLCPPLSAVQAWALFGETLTAVQLVGFVVATAGVVLARR